MTVASACLLAVFAVYAVADWWAVHVGNRRLEWVCKPAALAALTLAAVYLDPADEAVRAAFVVGLVLSLAGDVFLMLPREQFVAGLASFLLAHVAYIVGFLLAGPDPLLLALGLAVVAVGVVVVGRPLVRSVKAGPHAEEGGPVTAYVSVISAMVVAAFGAGNPVSIAGSLSFYASDATIGWTRFVGPLPHQRVLIMVTYHVGQLLLVLGLL